MTTRYSDQLEQARKDARLSLRQLAAQVAAKASGERGATYSGVRLYLSPDAPEVPRPAIIRTMAEILGVSVAWIMGETSDPTAKGEADVRRAAWGMLEREETRRVDAIERAFPDFRRLSVAAREALRDVMATLGAADIRRGGEPRSDVAAAKIVALALTSSLKALGLDKPGRERQLSDDTPEGLQTPFLHIPQSALSDFVVLSSQALKRLFIP